MTEQVKKAVVEFHKKLGEYCSKINFHCDGGDGPDCPFVEYCFRAANELSSESIEKAFDALNDTSPEGICARVLASHRSVFPDIPPA